MVSSPRDCPQGLYLRVHATLLRSKELATRLLNKPLKILKTHARLNSYNCFKPLETECRSRAGCLKGAEGKSACHRTKVGNTNLRRKAHNHSLLNPNELLYCLAQRSINITVTDTWRKKTLSHPLAISAGALNLALGLGDEALRPVSRLSVYHAFP